MNVDLAEEIGRRAGSEVKRLLPVGGGSTAECFRADLADGRSAFAKTHADPPVGLFATEADGLRWIAECPAIRVPTVIGGHEGLLIMDWVLPGAQSPLAEERLGRGLAELHRMGAPEFGRHRVGFIGDLPRDDSPADSWHEFWHERRLLPLVRMAVDKGAIAVEASVLLGRLSARLEDLVGPPQPPARVHGDLWIGNVVWGENDHPWLIDPAAHGGHRELDLAMLRLFDPPSERLFDAYAERFPLAAGWQERVTLFQLEPLLVHAVLFGPSWGAKAIATMERLA